VLYDDQPVGSSKALRAAATAPDEELVGVQRNLLRSHIALS
jgi:hypothetical protein